MDERRADKKEVLVYGSAVGRLLVFGGPESFMQGLPISSNCHQILFPDDDIQKGGERE